MPSPAPERRPASQAESAEALPGASWGVDSADLAGGDPCDLLQRRGRDLELASGFTERRLRFVAVGGRWRGGGALEFLAP